MLAQLLYVQSHKVTHTAACLDSTIDAGGDIIRNGELLSADFTDTITDGITLTKSQEGGAEASLSLSSNAITVNGNGASLSITEVEVSVTTAAAKFASHSRCIITNISIIRTTKCSICR